MSHASADARSPDPSTRHGGIDSIYHVRLPTFEGPLDLLLFLIRENRVDIHDIPIAEITDQYLQYIDLMQELRLDLAGEFFVMAATLMRLKIRMLLPRDEEVEEDEEEGDPREELVRRLLEYRKYREAALELSRREETRRKIFPRAPAPPPETPAEEGEEASFEFSLFDLLYALKGVLAQVRSEGVHRVRLESFSVEDSMESIRERLRRDGQALFTELFEGSRTKGEVIATFIAVLELLKVQELRARQEGPFQPLWIYPRSGEGETRSESTSSTGGGS
jgi:segregation and condensation protein A